MEKDGNHNLPNSNLIQEAEGYEENSSPDSVINETKINYDKGPKEAHKNTLEEEILQVINENFTEMILVSVYQNV
jgi:hypothetical protein